MRPFLCAVLLGSIAAGPAFGIDPPKMTRADYVADFDFLWKGIREDYAYFDKKATDWNRVKDHYRPQLAGVTTRDDFIAVLESVLEELYDAHAILNTNTASSPRLVPSGADIWAEWRKDRATVVAVRPGSNAGRAGIAAGMEIVSIDGVAVDRAVESRSGRCLRKIDPAARDYYLRALLAGRHNAGRRLEVLVDGRPKAVAIDDRKPSAERAGPVPALLEQKRVGEKLDLAYLRPNNSFGSLELLKEFDAALERANGTRGLILDLRDTPGGGNSAVARGILGRFIDRDVPYQKHGLPAEERETGIPRSWLELVSPRGPRYAGPVAVLVDRWTASMGEGTAIGFDAAKRATVVGTAMAGLAGAVQTITLPRSKIGASFPVEKLFHVNGTPREDFVPPISVDLMSPESRKSRDPILDAGLRTFDAPKK